MKKVKKKKLWSTTRADNEFSKYIRARDGKCLRPGCKKTDEMLSCSHFWSRRISDLRYEPDNCITLCNWSCHIYKWENEKQGEYRDFMIKRLGQARYDELRTVYYQPKMKRKEAIERCMTLLEAIHDAS